MKKLLIANRGEIAVRIIRAAKELGITTVAVYSTIDESSLHVQLADESVCIGPAKVSSSYLNMENIISAAMLTGSDAIHPGFGFLSENAKFARMVRECGLVFVGPEAEMIDMMGHKSKAREIMMAAKVPTVPGSAGAIEDIQTLKDLSLDMGYPVLVKAAAGGGGRGMRVAWSEDEVENAYNTAKQEAKIAFGDDTVYVEKYLLNPRHVEVQIIADQHGNTIHLGERDCSVQRRHQKLIEESPSNILTDDIRVKMGEAAIKAAKAVNYHNAGTVEFLVDKNKDFYFIEMNTRIQVEHPVTEYVTGIDLIKEQLRVAAGEKLSVKQEDVTFQGHSIECRINAEDPENDFRPSPGKIELLNLPGGHGVRVDTHIYQSYSVPPTYDSMLAKVIVHGKDREEAIAKMARALDEFVIDGLVTNIEYQRMLVTHDRFANGDYDTSFIETLKGEQ